MITKEQVSALITTILADKKDTGGITRVLWIGAG